MPADKKHAMKPIVNIIIYLHLPVGFTLYFSELQTIKDAKGTGWLCNKVLITLYLIPYYIVKRHWLHCN